jgi:hypothetical protein
MNNGQPASLGAREDTARIHRISDINAFVAQVIQKLGEARSLYELGYCYRSAYSDLERVWRPQIGYRREMPGEREIRQAFRTAYKAKIRERRREYQRNYMRRWRAANPEKARAQNRKAARTYREFLKMQEAVDEYYASLKSVSLPSASS